MWPYSDPLRLAFEGHLLWCSTQSSIFEFCLFVLFGFSTFPLFQLPPVPNSRFQPFHLRPHRKFHNVITGSCPSLCFRIVMFLSLHLCPHFALTSFSPFFVNASYVVFSVFMVSNTHLFSSVSETLMDTHIFSSVCIECVQWFIFIGLYHFSSSIPCR